jgi:predicted nucleic acid-binding protein
MKPVCCDTSFLVSLYGSDAHSSDSLQVLGRLHRPLTITELNEFEFEQTLRFLAWRKVLRAAEVARMLATFNADCVIGRFTLALPGLSSVIKQARRLSAKHTISNGHRIFDILLVAAALEIEASDFLTFDAGQSKLAKAEGLKVHP